MATRKATKRKYPEALTLLMQDHQKVRKLFKQFEKLNGNEQEMRQIVEKVCMELKIHAQLEEEVFYPAIRDALDDKSEMVDEAEVEHQIAKQLIQQIEGAQPNDPQYSASFKVLTEYVGHHIEEEENELFKEVKKADIDFEQLAQDMKQRKHELMQQAGIEDDSSNKKRNRSERDQESKRAHRAA